MKLISFDASPRQLSKLRNGHRVRIKKGSGFNLVVNPNNYSIVTRAFRKNKGVELALDNEELELNKGLSPDQHSALASEMDRDLFQPNMEGGNIFKKINKAFKPVGKEIKKAFSSKTAKKIGKELKPLGRELKGIGKDILHEKIADAQMAIADQYGDNEHARRALNASSNTAHNIVKGLGLGGKITLKKIGRDLKKAFTGKTAKKIGRELKPLGRELKSIGKDVLHEKIADAYMAGADQYGDNQYAQRAMGSTANTAHNIVSGLGLYAGRGLGGGLGGSMNVHDALRLANLATANANHQLAKMHNASVHGQITQPPIKRYWDEDDAPRSRGTGMYNHYNMVRGRGSLLKEDDFLPPALQSQPYGANFHFQFQLPPQYKRYNDGTDVEGRGLYV